MEDCYYGEIRYFGGAFAPRNFSFCSGQIQAISQNSALYSIIGSYYGGNGRTTMGYPELRGRVACNFGTGPGLTPLMIGTAFGAEHTTLSESQMPQHKHQAVFTGTGIAGGGGSSTTVETKVKASTTNGKKATPAVGDYIAAGFSSGLGGVPVENFVSEADKGATVELGGVTSTVSGGGSGGGIPLGVITVGNAGSSASFYNWQPTLSVSIILCHNGLYPARN